MSEKPETAVIILNWNGARLLPDCISALAAQSYRDFRLYLVDNGSIDDSPALLDSLEGTTQLSSLSASLPHTTRVIRNLDNMGFSAANNQAIKLAPEPYIVTLNNDAIPEPDWLGQLVETAATGGPQLGMVASTMLFAHLPAIVASAGISIHKNGVALDRGLGMPVADFEEQGPHAVFGPSAGAALYKRSMLRDVGLFDERFFSYLEDADLAWRARWRGWRAMYNPHAKVRHIYSATGGQESPFKRRLVARNRVWMVYKNMPEALLRRYWPSVVLYDALVAVRGVAVGDWYSIRGRSEALRRLGELTVDRRKITTSMRLHPDELSHLLARPLSPRHALKYRKRLNHLLSTR